MILDRLEGAKQKYVWLPAPFHAAFDFLSHPETAKLPDGKHSIDGDRLFAIIQQYEPKPIDQCRLEAHRRYWDVQYLSGGEERMGWAPLDESLQVTEPHDVSRDVGFFRGNCQLFNVPAGTFVIFGPHDAHMPSIAVESNAVEKQGQTAAQMVRKIVVKVELK
jgi:biofilm protein TabA